MAFNVFCTMEVKCYHCENRYIVVLCYLCLRKMGLIVIKMNPLDHEAIWFPVAFAKPICRFSQPKGIPTYRISFEVNEELFNLFSNARSPFSVLLGGQLQVAGNADIPDTSGGYFSNRAGMLCRDPLFHAYVAQRCQRKVTEQEAATWMRHNCQIESRRELDHKLEARQAFTRIVNAFKEWCQKNRFECHYLQL